MKVTFLGTGTSVGVPAIGCECSVCTSTDPCNRRTRTSAMLSWEDHTVLIDASIDMRLQALREGMKRLDAVLLTHGHADHVFGLDDVRIFNYRQQRSIPIYASPRTLSEIRKTFWYVFDDAPDASSRPQLELQEAAAPFQLGGVTVVPFPVQHGTIPILGYRIGRFAYITDGWRIPDESLEVLGDLDVLVINALRHRPHPTHFNLDGALEAIASIRPARAFLTHISHEMDHSTLTGQLPPGIRPAHDGLTIDVDHSP